MTTLGKPVWLSSLVFASIVSVVFGLVHVSDAIVRGEIGNPSYEPLDATLNVFYSVAYLFAISLAWNQKRYGYGVLIIFSALNGWALLGHASGITPPTIVEIGRASGALFVFVILMGSVASVSSILLGIYGLTRRK